MLELLPVVDNFERALNSEEDKDTPLYKGVSMIYRQLLSVIEKFDMVPIKSIGEAFDPSLHEAVAVEEISDTELDGKIVKEIQRGYVLKGEVIRPAKVIVGKLTDETEEEVGKDE
jgi:molecular chaperone GrpE